MQVFTGECRYGNDQSDRIWPQYEIGHFVDCYNLCLTTYACTAFDVWMRSDYELTCRLYKGGPYTYATPCTDCDSVVCYVLPEGMYLLR